MANGILNMDCPKASLMLLRVLDNSNPASIPSSGDHDNISNIKLDEVADKNNDTEMQHFIESEYLEEQVESIKKIEKYVTQLRMVGNGHGVWHFDQMLLHEAHAA
ncbi:hypothetical protein OIU78_019318 [Salix suchowensis]|nr:hypothetical protein OIU78_019318 [Salix suchowensis]